MQDKKRDDRGGWKKQHTSKQMCPLTQAQTLPS